MYKFKKEFADAQIVLPGSREVINAENLNDAKAEMILKKYPQYAHNIEQVAPDSVNESEQDDQPKKKGKKSAPDLSE